MCITHVKRERDRELEEERGGGRHIELEGETEGERRERHGVRTYYFAEMCSGPEAGSYLRLIDFVYHSTLGLRVITKKNMSPS